MKQQTLATSALSVALACGWLSAAHAGELRAGAAKLAITPTADEFPYQIGREKPFVGVHDDVFVRALVLDDGARRIAIVSAEVTAIPNAEKMVKIVADAAKVPVTNVMLTASHTHNSLFVFYRGRDVTPAQQQELNRLEKNTAAAVRDAMDHLQPARISFGRGKAYANINTCRDGNRQAPGADAQLRLPRRGYVPQRDQEWWLRSYRRSARSHLATARGKCGTGAGGAVHERC